MQTPAQLDLFTINPYGPSLRDNSDAMGYPFVSLQKKRTKPIEYHAKGVFISIAADSRFAIASIWDWDIIILAASHLNDAIESGRKLPERSPRICFIPFEALRQIRRGTGGKDYHELAQAIRRLRMTTVITNIRVDDEAGEERPFSWLSDYAIPRRYKQGAWITPNDPEGDPDPTRPWEIELPPWLYNAILRQREILAVHPDYYELTGGIERWLYRLARKSVPDRGKPPEFTFRMETLHQRSGTTRALNKFAFDIRKIADEQPLPEYGLKIRKVGRFEKVTLYRDITKSPRPMRGQKLAAISGKIS